MNQLNNQSKTISCLDLRGSKGVIKCYGGIAITFRQSNMAALSWMHMSHKMMEPTSANL